MRTIISVTLVLFCIMTGCSRAPQKCYSFVLPSADGLKERTVIRFKGLRVGYIHDIRLDSGKASTVVATGYITEPQMRVVSGDTARIIVPGLLANEEIEIIRGADAGAELPVGSAIPVAPRPGPPSALTNLLDVASEFLNLPADKQQQVAQQFRSIVEAAKNRSPSNTTNGSR